MSLDTVELIYTIEECFGVTFSDKDAARIRTVEDAAKLVWQAHNHVDQTEVHQAKLIKDLAEYIYAKNELRFSPSDNICDFLLSLQGQESIVSFCLESNWLCPEVKTQPIWKPNIFRQASYPHRKLVTLKDLSDWIISLNYKHFIDPRAPRNLYEIQRIMVSITAHSVGLPIAQIELRHSFSTDLGID